MLTEGINQLSSGDTVDGADKSMGNSLVDGLFKQGYILSGTGQASVTMSYEFSQSSGIKLT